MKNVEASFKDSEKCPDPQIIRNNVNKLFGVQEVDCHMIFVQN